MSNTIISVRNLGKRYRLGATIRHDTLCDQLKHAGQRLIGKRRTADLSASSRSASSSEFWALRDVSFDVAQGEVVGVIGANGAGKSTLLKVLSQITEPSAGEVCIRGRVASLLEIGTGMHPELSGKENVYLNGAVLGMRRSEIDRTYDDIVEFAGVADFMSTPIKRYSSGMRVRLGFAVAAHLQPEILLVDEVLAVGDLAFQKKCLSKMGDVAQAGRTVLFVSHNMTAVSNLCPRTVLLDHGAVIFDGETEDAIQRYRQASLPSEGKAGETPRRFETTAECRITSVEVLGEALEPVSYLRTGQPATLRLHYQLDRPLRSPSFGLRFMSPDRLPVMRLVSDACGYHVDRLPEGAGYVDCHLPSLPFTKGQVTVDVDLHVRGGSFHHIVEGAVVLDVVEGDFYGTGVTFDSGRGHGFFVCRHSWSYDGVASDEMQHEGA